MTITLTHEEAQQVLNALENFCEHGAILKPIEVRDLLRARLAQPEPEPVAYGVLDDNGQIDWTAEYPFSNEPGWPDSVPLYTAPPQREWQGLTDEEMADAWAQSKGDVLLRLKPFAHAIEDKLREKNGNL